jgi:hypothetical protein
VHDVAPAAKVLRHLHVRVERLPVRENFIFRPEGFIGLQPKQL